MKTTPSLFTGGVALLALAATFFAVRASGPAESAAQPRSGPLAEAFSPEVWRRERRIIDVHQHVGGKPEHFDRALTVMNGSGVGTGLILGAGTVTKADGQPSEHERVMALAEQKAPGRFMGSMILDYAGWDEPDWSEKAAKQVEEGFRLGSAGLKEFKRLGLFLRDGKGNLIKVDDPKLDAVWAKCGELGMPVSIHVADPKAFWLPFEPGNERWAELRDHKSWWFGDPAKHPPRMEIVEALSRVISRHPKTTFICVHFGNNPEDIDWVDRELDAHPNMLIDIAARIPEVGRGAPEKVRAFFTKHQDRILFATDFMVYDRLILGSAGDAERPTDTDGIVFYQKCWRWFETADRDWPHMTPIQGDWTISSIDLPPEVLRKVYFDNARRVFARSMPVPTVQAVKIARDFAPDGAFDEPEWKKATPARMEYQSDDARAKPQLSTPVSALWSDRFLYLGYECPFTELTTFNPPEKAERIGLWDKDVVEAFIGPDPARPGFYTEYEWAPTGEQLDLKLDLPARDFAWSSGMESAVKIDAEAKVWRVEVRIPLAALAETRPTAGTRWKANFYRMDRAAKAGLAWSPVLAGTFHTPAKFGWLEFVAD